MGPGAAAPDTAEWFGQPPGLTILFLTQMWEEFSYYGMRSLLVLYLTLGLHFPPAQASLIYGLYTGSAYFTPLIGGPLADRYLGHRNAIVIGGAVMAIGHFMMAFPPLLYPALATIALGNGLFLPTLPGQIGDLYADDDPRREAGYTVYYAGLNLGAVLAPLVCGVLGATYGWHVGFGAAGVGMLLGLVIYLSGARRLRLARVRASGPAARREHRGREVLLLFAVLAAVVLYRGAYEQAGNALALWTSTGIDRHVAGVEIPAALFQSLDPLFVLLLTPLIVRRARRLAHAENEARMMTRGALLTSAAFAMICLVAWMSRGPASGLWLIAFFAVYTLGELYVLPTGLALFGRFAPSGRAATSMAFWYSGIFAGNLLAGLLGTSWTGLGPSSFFAMIAALAALAAAAFTLLIRPVSALGGKA